MMGNDAKEREFFLKELRSRGSRGNGIVTKIESPDVSITRKVRDSSRRLLQAICRSLLRSLWFHFGWPVLKSPEWTRIIFFQFFSRLAFQLSIPDCGRLAGPANHVTSLQDMIWRGFFRILAHHVYAISAFRVRHSA
ncbi:MAG: hypothetical protein ACRED1_09595, partial [Limisphaerales bacterium]